MKWRALAFWRVREAPPEPPPFDSRQDLLEEARQRYDRASGRLYEAFGIERRSGVDRRQGDRRGQPARA